MTRGDAALPANEQGRSMAEFDTFNDKPALRDTTLADRLAIQGLARLSRAQG
jgi:hypothetical protein